VFKGVKIKTSQNTRQFQSRPATAAGSTFSAADAIVTQMTGIRWTILVLLLAACGCSNKLETGYEPTKLGGMTPAERRGLYAQDYTPEAAQAQSDQQTNSQDFHGGLPGGHP
jgi:hypothetical protein